MKLLREAIRQMLLEEIELTNKEDDMIKQLAFSISPPPTQQQRIEELMTIQHQIAFPFNPPELNDTLDDNFYQLEAYCYRQSNSSIAHRCWCTLPI